jgi:small multidrug resistance pump
LNVWLLLAICIAAEVAATSLLKASEGFSKPLYGVASIILYSGCFWALSFVMTRIPVGVTYAVWSGVGIAAISLIGWLAFKQPLSPLQILFVGLIVVGAIGLNLTTKVH